MAITIGPSQIILPPLPRFPQGPPQSLRPEAQAFVGPVPLPPAPPPGATPGINSAANPRPGLLGRINQGLGALFTNPASQQRLAMAAALLQAGGPSVRPVGLGQAIGAALSAGQEAQRAFQEQQIATAQAQARQAQAAAALQNARQPEVTMISGAQANEMLGTDTFAPDDSIELLDNQRFGKVFTAPQIDPATGESQSIELTQDVPGVGTAGQVLTGIETEAGTVEVDLGNGQRAQLTGTQFRDPITRTEVREGGLAQPTINDLEASIISGQDQIAEFEQLREDFEPAALTFLGRLGIGVGSALDQIDPRLLTDEQKERLTELTGFQSAGRRRLNAYIQAITGAQLSVFEAERIRGGVPDIEGIGPTEYLARLDSVLNELRAAQARARVALQRGITDPELFASQVGPLSAFGGGTAESELSQEEQDLLDAFNEASGAP